MTRYRASSGRHVHRRPGGPAVTYPGVPAPQHRPLGSWPLATTTAPGPDPARGPGRETSALRTGLKAATIAGGALALAGAAVAVTTPAAAPHAATLEPATVLQLAAGDSPAATATSTLRTADRLASAPGAAPALPAPVSVTNLVKAAGLAEAAERARQPVVTRPVARSSCATDPDGLGGVRPVARNAARFLSCVYDGPELASAGSRDDDADVPSGLTIDIKARGAKGDRIAACALANRKELGVDSVLWKERANDGDGWERVSDQDGDGDKAGAKDKATAEYRDHVRILFNSSAPKGAPVAGRCR